MPKSSSEQVTDRVLRLAAYIAHERVFTLDKATIDVEGYGEAVRNPDGSLRSDAKGYDALRSRFRRDLEILRAEFGIEAPYDSEAADYELSTPVLHAERAPRADRRRRRRRHHPRGRGRRRP